MQNFFGSEKLSAHSFPFQSEVISMIEELLPRLEAADFIWRYSWWVTRWDILFLGKIFMLLKLLTFKLLTFKLSFVKPQDLKFPSLRSRKECEFRFFSSFRLTVACKRLLSQIHLSQMNIWANLSFQVLPRPTRWQRQFLDRPGQLPPRIWQRNPHRCGQGEQSISFAWLTLDNDNHDLDHRGASPLLAGFTFASQFYSLSLFTAHNCTAVQCN